MVGDGDPDPERDLDLSAYAKLLQPSTRRNVRKTAVVLSVVRAIVVLYYISAECSGAGLFILTVRTPTNANEAICIALRLR